MRDLIFYLEIVSMQMYTLKTSRIISCWSFVNHKTMSKRFQPHLTSVIAVFEVYEAQALVTSCFYAVPENTTMANSLASYVICMLVVARFQYTPMSLQCSSQVPPPVWKLLNLQIISLAQYTGNCSQHCNLNKCGWGTLPAF